jgi:hypothetical protein
MSAGRASRRIIGRFAGHGKLTSAWASQIETTRARLLVNDALIGTSFILGQCARPKAAEDVHLFEGSFVPVGPDDEGLRPAEPRRWAGRCACRPARGG